MNFNSRNTPSFLNLTKKGHLSSCPIRICLKLPFRWHRANISCERAFRQKLPSVQKQVGSGIHSKGAGVGILQARSNSLFCTIFSHYSLYERLRSSISFCKTLPYILPPSQRKVWTKVTAMEPKEMAILFQRKANGQVTQNDAKSH